MSKLVSPYRNIKQHSRVSLLPQYMNTYIFSNIKKELKKKLEKKCNKNGYIDEVYRIIDYHDGIIIPENFNGAALYNVSYYCRICIPIEDSIIIVKVICINVSNIISVNGPLVVFIDSNTDSRLINYNEWSKDFIKLSSKRKLSIGDKIKIKIISKKINKGGSKIIIIGELIDFATDEDIEKYYGVNNDL